MIILGMMFYATVVILQTVFEYSEIQFNKSTEKLTLVNEREIHNFTGSNGIKFAIGWMTVDEKPIERDVGRIIVLQENWDFIENDENSFRNQTDVIELNPCSISNFSKGLLDDSGHI